MKTRESLVSNSSSSSFICRSRVDIIAKEMWKIASKDLLDYAEKGEKKKIISMNKKLSDSLKLACKREDILSGLFGIAIPCCNGPAYLLRVGDETYIEAPNNHQWQDDIDDALIFADEDLTYNALKDKIFYYIDSGSLMTHDGDEYVIPEPVKVYCPECKKKDRTYKALDEKYHAEVALKGVTGELHCTCHHTRLKPCKVTKKK